MNRLFFAVLFAVLAASRLCHIGILWEGETLPLAAAVQMLDGKVLYRDVWYDKPPLAPAINLLWGGLTGWPLRLAGALYALGACALLYRFASRMWSEREGRLAAGLLGFFLIFWIPTAVIPMGPDLLLLAPHIAAVYFAWRGRAFLSGALAGVGLLFNSKAVFVLAACALWQYRRLPQLALGFALPNAVALGWMGARGALGAYYEQVWQWGVLYARNTFLENPAAEGLVRTVNWMGFQIALVLGAGWCWLRDRDSDRWRLAGWAVLSLAAVAAGWRFFPRYYFQLLPVMALVGSRGLVLMGKRRAVLVLLTLTVPLVRFGPRYVLLAAGRSTTWADTAMDRDSRAAAKVVRARARPGDTLFVWGYRPELFVYTRMPAASRFLESQPLSGVLADRHLFQSGSVAPEWAKRNREELVRSRPSFVVDGLARYNPRLGIERYEDLRGWLAGYERVGETGGTVVWKLVARSP